jgi:DNA-binding transcriptional MocR family regulator
MLTIDREHQGFLYQQVVDLIAENISAGTLRPGDRLPSLRQMSKQAGVSVPTVRQAYIELERQRRIESRPQSGFYVRAGRELELVQPSPRFDRSLSPQPVRGRSLMDRVYDGLYRTDVVPLGIANPCMAKPAVKGLQRTMKRVMSRTQERSLGYAPTCGEPTLRRQVAWRYLDTVGTAVDPDDVCITNGAQEALSLALQAVAGKGDVVAVESPTYHGLLELIDSLGMLAIEVETCPEEGVMLSSLEKTLDAHPVRVCMFSPTLSNPLGVSMPETKRKALANLLDARDIVLIEDDVYGELRFDAERPNPVASFMRSDRVMTCGSFSKTAAPGYRIGWLVTGAYRDEVRRLKRSISCSSGLLQQLTLAEFLASGDYDRYLKALRPVLRTNAHRMFARVARYFPPGTRMSDPVGGSVLWVEMPEGIDSEVLFDAALDNGISIAPGPIFSPCTRYDNCIRLSFGHPWSDEIDDSIRWLGENAARMAAMVN